MAILTVFLSISYSRGWKEVKRSFRDISDPPDCLFSVLCPTPRQKLNYVLCGIPGLLIYALWKLVLIVGSLVPLPGLTNLYRFYLDVRSQIRRSKPNFRFVSMEEEIREHEALGELRKVLINHIHISFFYFYNTSF